MLQEEFISFYYDIVSAPAKPYLQPVEFGAIEPEMPNEPTYEPQYRFKRHDHP
jgi:hypothetical protein